MYTLVLVGNLARLLSIAGSIIIYSFFHMNTRWQAYMDNIPKIALVGVAGVGKTSFLNALAGHFIGSIYPRHKTYHPEVWIFNQGETDELDSIHSFNQKVKASRSDASNIKKEAIIRGRYSSSLINRRFTVTDMPGISPTSAGNIMFRRMIMSNIDDINLFIFITSADAAFTSRGEHHMFLNLKKIIDKKNKDGIWTDLVVLLNKSDKPGIVSKKMLSDKLGIRPDKIYIGSASLLFHDHLILKQETLLPPAYISREYDKICNRCLDCSDTMKMISHRILEYIECLDLAESISDTCLLSIQDYYIGRDKGASIDGYLKQISLCPGILYYPEFWKWVGRELKYTKHINTAQVYLIHKLCQYPDTPRYLNRIDGLCPDLVFLVNIIQSISGSYIGLYDLIASAVEVYDGILIDVMPTVSIKISGSKAGMLDCDICYGPCSKYRYDGMFICDNHITGTNQGACLYCDDDASKLVKVRGVSHMICNKEISKIDSIWLIDILEYLEHLDSTCQDIQYIVNLIRISRTPIPKLLYTNQIYPGYYQRFFIRTPELYPVFLQLLYYGFYNNSQIIGRSMFRSVSRWQILDQLALIVGRDLDMINREYSYC